MIKHYLRYRYPALACYALCVLCVFAVTSLGGQALSLPLYGLFVAGFLMLIVAIVDFIRFYRRVRALRQIAAQAAQNPQELPPPENAAERAYQQMIESLYAGWADSRNALEKLRAGQLTYFTLWVHQIKTPLSAMRLALEEADREDARAVLKRELFKVEQYADMALQYARMERFSGDLQAERVDLQALCRACVRKYATLFVYQGLSVTVEDFTAHAHTDAKWLGFVVEQLLSNAVKYTKQGGVRISYQNRVLEIADTGIGIRAQDIARVFDKGFTGYNGRLDTRASGLGLFMCKQVCAQLGITLALQSAPGRGTTALLRFPPEIENVTNL